ncbi:CHASE2 domain-containing protein [[Phormidium] sp. ETS-05]|uniref:CHASE2 domain-containing protein n=1 Tax=[Phormidium] sp. ETS-05 TaxID=222819 RepID=UPI0018EED6DA|nr:adenylate/guanylate cyclase domain-containing protein [[Phormidium] sp. ETS-05]
MVVFKNWIHAYLTSNNPLLPGGVAAALSLGMWLVGVWEPLERLGGNVLYRLRPDLDWDSRLAAIVIDESSLQAYGQFPWPRSRYVELLQALAKSPPAVIGFDILFLDPSDNDDALAAAIKADGKVVLASVGYQETVDGKIQQTIAPPLPVLKAAAAATGQISHTPEPDGISREATLFFTSEPALGVAMLQFYNRSGKWAAVELPSPPPIAKVQKVWLNWPGPLQSNPQSGIIDAIPTYPFVDVVEGRVPPDAFTDKLVLVGYAAEGLDTIVSPIQKMPGVYLHAALIDNLLNNRLLQRLPAPVTWLLLLGIGLGSSWLQFNRKLSQRLALSLLLPAGWFVIAFTAFYLGNWWLPVAAPIGTIVLSGSAITLRDQYEKQQLMSLFAKQVSPEMAEMIWSRKAEIFTNGELPAQELTATVMFMDIRGFTTISETMPPPELFAWLNEYLDAMSNCIMDCEGAIDKYIGDAIMAVFGIPFPRSSEAEIKRDATNAITACLAMHDRLQPLNENLKSRGLPAIKIGIGMHTGPLMAGSVGGKRRANYSVIGDTVNTAARLEPMNKQFTENNPYNLLISGDTFELVKDTFNGIQVGEIQLRGKHETTQIYAIVGQR